MVNKIKLLVVGAGGTGGVALPYICRLLSCRTANDFSLFCCDGDTVERKNLSRQAFIEEEIGENKAISLASRCEATYGVEVTPISHYLESVKDVKEVFSPGGLKVVNVLICCVDNLKARKVFEEWFEGEENAVYIDAANEEYNGEVVYASKFQGLLSSPPRSKVLPSFGQLLKKEEATLKFRSEEDCLTRSISSPQHFLTNGFAGLLVASAVCDLMERGIIPSGITFFNAKEKMVCHRDTSCKEVWKA